MLSFPGWTEVAGVLELSAGAGMSGGESKAFRFMVAVQVVSCFVAVLMLFFMT